MTNEELELEMKELDAQIERLGPDENKLTGKQWREKINLRQQKDCLEKIKKARDKGNMTQEANQMATWAVLKESKRRHPLLAYIMQLKCRSHIY